MRRPLGRDRAVARVGWHFAALLLLVLAGGAPATAAVSTTTDVPYVWRLPPGFPPPPVPPDNPMSAVKVELGRRLFFDPRLSVNGQQSCASCHRPELAFTDGRPRAVGATGELVARSAMSLANVAYNPAFTWADATVRSLEAQMRQPLFNEHPVEMGLAGREAAVTAALAADPAYRDLFAAAFAGADPPVCIDHLIKAIAAFERTLIFGRSAFDRYVFDDERDALSPAARRGMALFYSARGGCAECHFGLNFSGPIAYRAHTGPAALYANTGLYNVDGHGGYPATDRGLIAHTRMAGDMGRFRVPTLRNIALTAPYMHDGSLVTLRDVIDHYDRGGREAPLGTTRANRLKDRRVRALSLSADDKSDLEAFLASLTDAAFTPGQDAKRGQ